MIVTIDGPAGAGKSSAAKLLAQRLGFRFLDTGAMYRAVALAAMQANVNLDNHQQVVELLKQTTIEFEDDHHLKLNGKDVTRKIRDPGISQSASRVAAIPQVREQLVVIQRQIANTGDFVCEGRDQGTVVFPHAACKIFLTATAEIRAQRRWKELQESQPGLDLDEVVAEQKIRDLRDETRSTGRLLRADDAIEIRADHLSLEQIVDQLEAEVRNAFKASQK